jgi:hypothetical protein
MMPLCPGYRAPYISYTKGCAEFGASGGGPEAEKHPLPVSASFGKKRRRGSLKHASARVTVASGLSGFLRPVSYAGGSGWTFVNPCGALERHLLQSGAARDSGKKNDVDI